MDAQLDSDLFRRSEDGVIVRIAQKPKWVQYWWKKPRLLSGEIKELADYKPDGWPQPRSDGQLHFDGRPEYCIRCGTYPPVEGSLSQICHQCLIKVRNKIAFDLIEGIGPKPAASATELTPPASYVNQFA